MGGGEVRGHVVLLEEELPGNVGGALAQGDAHATALLGEGLDLPERVVHLDGVQQLLGVEQRRGSLDAERQGVRGERVRDVLRLDRGGDGHVHAHLHRILIPIVALHRRPTVPSSRRPRASSNGSPRKDGARRAKRRSMARGGGSRLERVAGILLTLHLGKIETRRRTVHRTFVSCDPHAPRAAFICSFCALYLSWHCLASFPGTHAAIFFPAVPLLRVFRFRHATRASAKRFVCSSVHAPSSALAAASPANVGFPRVVFTPICDAGVVRRAGEGVSRRYAFRLRLTPGGRRGGKMRDGTRWDASEPCLVARHDLLGRARAPALGEERADLLPPIDGAHRELLVARLVQRRELVLRPRLRGGGSLRRRRRRARVFASSAFFARSSCSAPSTLASASQSAATMASGSSRGSAASHSALSAAKSSAPHSSSTSRHPGGRSIPPPWRRRCEGAPSLCG